MDQEKLIQVSFQIPPSALDSLSRLAEQLRLLSEAANAPIVSSSTPAETEHLENGSFDPERFVTLQRTADTPKPVNVEVSDIGDAPTVFASFSQAEDAEAVSAVVQKDLLDAKSAGEALHRDPDGTENSDAVPRYPQTRPAAESAQADPIPAVAADAEEIIPDAREARREAEQDVPDVESVRAEAKEQELLLAAARGEVSDGVEAPLGAGVVVQAQPEMPKSRWTDVTEELVVPGPAPLTAEAVSLAFERDGRRYDNGFPLY